ncbi:MAG TPA: SLATT domain-containing protein [Bryobacteraceae bacterium]|nr:SLATT domain-containing protein [Bryobacteraceae bacterium]
MANPTNPANSKNIHAPEAQCLAWNCSQIDDSLARLCDFASQLGQEAVDWYFKNKRWKRIWSRFIQGSAVVLAAAAGLIPILAVLLKPAGQAASSFDSGLVASLLVGLAASLLGLDKAFGFSTAWARYVLTATTIRKAVVEFQLDWISLNAARCAVPSAENTMALIQRAKEFSSTVEGLVLQETKDWVTEFQANMAQLEKDVNAQLDALNAKVERARQAQLAVKPSSLELTVPGADKTDRFEFQVTLEPLGGAAITETVSHAQVWVKTGLPPGHAKITVSAAIGGKAVLKQKIADLKSGEIHTESIQLDAP